MTGPLRQVIHLSVSIKLFLTQYLRMLHPGEVSNLYREFFKVSRKLQDFLLLGWASIFLALTSNFPLNLLLRSQRD